MKKLSLIALLLSVSTLSFAQDNDVTTKPDLYFLKSSEVIDSFKLLPPPPAVDSVQFLNDKAQYEKGKLLRNTERGKQAYKDAYVAADVCHKHFQKRLV
ncbi:hypothetical protein P9107_03085 [Gallibacterium anatis]|uniref:hypothetical protein n=1 Tax=Gallibacterium anatis TaxID=750 RepID=UPI0030076D60